MQIFGGKAKLGPAIARILEGLRPPGAPVVEPFCGSANVTVHLSGERRASDVDGNLIALLEGVRDGWKPPARVSPRRYQALLDGSIDDPKLRAFIGYGCSWGGKWLGGFARSDTQNYAESAARSLRRKAALLRGVQFRAVDYRTLRPSGCLIYCDPPYDSTTAHSPGSSLAGFDSEEFWSIMREWSRTNVVVISEYAAPPDFESIAAFPRKLSVQNASAAGARVERLFRLRGTASQKLSAPGPRRLGRRLVPTGVCWCGCAAEVRLGSFFAKGHDRVALMRVVVGEYGSTAAFLEAHGYAPGGRRRKA